MLHIPVSCLKNTAELLELLKAPNPEYDSARRFSRFATREPEFLFFYTLDEESRSVIVPRNIPKSILSDVSVSVADDTSNGVEIPASLSPQFKFRQYQKDYFEGEDGVLAQIDKGETDVSLIVPCGHGKTIMALYLANIFRRNTIVVVTTDNQVRQYKKAVSTYFPDWTCEKFKEKKPLFDITIATYDLLSADRFDTKFFAQFGHVIFDEVHRIGAKTYACIAEKAVCKYRTSLTATFRRRDGLDGIMKHHCGVQLKMDRQSDGALVVPMETGIKMSIAKFRVLEKKALPYKMVQEYSEVVVKDNSGKILVEGAVVKKEHLGENEYSITVTKNTTTVVCEHGKHKIYRYGPISMANVDTFISEHPERNEIIRKLIVREYRHGRVILVLSKRKEFLFNMAELLTSSGIENGVMVSHADEQYKKYCENLGRTPEQQELYCVYECPVILGIDKLAAEALDIERLDTLIYAHPMRDIEQSTGRILREYPEKQKPVVFYLLDDFSIYRTYYFDKKKGALKMFRDLDHTIYKKVYAKDFLK